MDCYPPATVNNAINVGIQISLKTLLSDHLICSIDRTYDL